MEMIVSSCETGDHDWEPVQVSESWLWIRFCKDCGGVDVDYICEQVYRQMEDMQRKMRHLSVYRCGLGGDVWRAWRALRIGMGWKAARGELRKSTRIMGRWMRERNWRAVRMHLKGWMAEPYADGMITWTKCGAGWTRAGAVRSFHRRQAKYWLYEHYTQKTEMKYRFNLNDDECLHCKVSEDR